MGKGGLLLISDTRFFSDMNVEDMSGFWPGNLAFIHDMFKRYLGADPDSVKPLFRSPEKPPGLAALDQFGSPWITGFFLIVAGFAADRAVKSLINPEAASNPSRSSPRLRTRFASSAAMAVLSASAALAWEFVPPGPGKAGRILIDDRFCGIWEPTARQLDTAWYGDFPTYSFTSLAEWLGKWFLIDVNTSKPYDDELLSRYDTLIFKTPEEPIPDAAAAAIDRFVRQVGACSWSATTPICSGWGRTLTRCAQGTEYDSDTTRFLTA